LEPGGSIMVGKTIVHESGVVRASQLIRSVGPTFGEGDDGRI
jgi:hypothetical protein